MNSDGEDDDDEDDEEEDGDDEDEQAAGSSSQLGQSVEILFTLPPNYPDEKPSIKILDSTNLEEYELSNLITILDEKCDESLGTVMVFSLVTDVIEWLSNKSDEEAHEVEQEKERRQRERESIEKKKIDGTLVTEQTFLAWKAKFDAEMIKLNIDQSKQQPEQNSKRLTGRVMFESDKTLAESDLDFVEDLDQNQIEALLHNIEEVDLDDVEDEDFELASDEENESHSDDDGESDSIDETNSDEGGRRKVS